MMAKQPVGGEPAGVGSRSSLTRAMAFAPPWRRYRVTFDQLAVNSNNNDIELFQLPVYGAMHGVIIVPTTRFLGGTLTQYNLTVGVEGDLDKYHAGFNVGQAIGHRVFSPSTVFGMESYEQTTSMRLAATSVGGQLDDATQGSVDVFVWWSVMPFEE